MSERRKSAFLQGLTGSLPIAMGYLPIALSFGLVASQAGLPALAVVLVSCLVFAGGSQFVLVSLLAGAAPAWSVVMTVTLMNARHFFYGLSVAQRLGAPRWPRALMAFGLTDEVYALSLGRLPALSEPQRQPWLAGVQLGAYAAWVLGTVLGVTFQDRLVTLSGAWRETLDFVLPALFLALLLEISGKRGRLPLVGAGVGTFAMLWFLPAHLALLLGMLCGAGLGVLGRGRQ